MIIDHDFHIHTTLSLCAHDDTATVENYVRRAKDLGLRKLGFSNHMWDSSARPASGNFYEVQDYAHVAQLRSEIDRCSAESGVDLYFGCEVEYDPIRRDIALTERTAQAFDYILVPNSHTHMMMPEEYYEPKARHAQFMFDAFMDIVTSPLAKYVTAVAHPFSAVCCPYDRRLLYPLISEKQYREAFVCAREHDIAIELNISGYTEYGIREIVQDPTIRMFRIAKECGCKFIFGSDAHSAAAGETHDFWWIAYILAELLELKEADLTEIVRR